MSDQALAWKTAFGVLVLLFCGVAYVGRWVDERTTVTTTAVPLPPPAAVDLQPLPAAAPPATAEAAPLDMPDAQEAPPERVHFGLREAPGVKKQKSAKHVPAAKVRFVRSAHPVMGRTQHASPYRVGRKHYPFDPRDRDHWREAGT